MKLKDFNFGFADAAREFKLYREIFNLGFHDPSNILDSILIHHKFLVVGRKGVGKTAILSKIEYESIKEEQSYSIPISFDTNLFNEIKKTNVNKDISGVQKYKSTWDFLILLIIVKHLYNNCEVQDENFINCVSFLEKSGIDIYKSNLNKDSNFLSKLKLSGGVPGFSAAFETEFSEKNSNYTNTIYTITEFIRNSLNNVYLPEMKVRILLDGLDDILRYNNSERGEITKSLIRSVNDLNMELVDLSFETKIVLSIREDILANLNDPDMNKIRRDGAINVDWRSKPEELKNIVRKRLVFSGMEEDNSFEYINKIFPGMVRKKTAWEYILDRTLYKPRDILQFFITCKELYPDNDFLTVGQIKHCLKAYSEDYFMGEMKDELTGFIKDDYILVLPTVFKIIGGDNFNIERFRKLIDEYSRTSNISDDDLKLLANLLYDSGYLGQVIENYNTRYHHKRQSINFKYRNPTSQLDTKNSLLIHLGIQAGLGVAH